MKNKRKIKRFVIEKRVNPNDEWLPYKKFFKEDKAIQSLDMLKKHTNNLFKNTDYENYRLQIK